MDLEPAPPPPPPPLMLNDNVKKLFPSAEILKSRDMMDTAQLHFTTPMIKLMYYDPNSIPQPYCRVPCIEVIQISKYFADVFTVDNPLFSSSSSPSDCPCHFMCVASFFLIVMPTS